MMIDLFQPYADVGSLQRVLLVRGGERWQVRSDEIHQPSRFIDIHGHRGKLVGKRGRSGHDLLEQSKDIALQCFQLGALGRDGLRHRLGISQHERRQLGEFTKPYALQALREDE